MAEGATESGSRKDLQRSKSRSAKNIADRLFSFGKNLDAQGREAHNMRNSRRCSPDADKSTKSAADWRGESVARM
jgi:hypothetical protein